MPSSATTFRPGAEHPRYKRGKAAVPRLADGRSLYDLFRSYTEDAATLLAAVMHYTGEEMELRVKAASIILARGWGDAPKEVGLRLVTEKTAGEMSEAELMSIALGKTVPPPITVVEAEAANAG